jgi:hypothetical protein
MTANQRMPKIGGFGRRPWRRIGRRLLIRFVSKSLEKPGWTSVRN